MMAVGDDAIPKGETRYTFPQLSHRTDVAVAHGQGLIQLIPDGAQRGHHTIGT
ncbi:hypothetical protein D3C87_2008320 [compost metagenome]